MADNFLQPPDDTVASIEEPEEELLGIAGYIKDKFKSMGYENFLSLETTLREASELPWTKKIMSFNKLPL